MPDAITTANQPGIFEEQTIAVNEGSHAFVRMYGMIYARMLAIAVPVSWAIVMASSMSFLRSNTIEGMVTGLTASIVVAAVALGLVVPVALGHWWIHSRTSSEPDRLQRRRFVAAIANVLLLLLWAVVMILQHWLGANIFFWHRFGIDEPSPLFNPEIDASWSRVYFVLVGITAIVGIGRYRRPSYAVSWLLLTVGTALGWVILTFLFTRSNDLIDHRISIAALEGTPTWWMPGGVGGTILLVLVILIGVARVRSAWLSMRRPGLAADR